MVDVDSTSQSFLKQMPVQLHITAPQNLLTSIGIRPLLGIIINQDDNGNFLVRLVHPIDYNDIHYIYLIGVADGGHDDVIPLRMGEQIHCQLLYKDTAEIESSLQQSLVEADSNETLRIHATLQVI